MAKRKHTLSSLFKSTLSITSCLLIITLTINASTLFFSRNALVSLSNTDYDKISSLNLIQQSLSNGLGEITTLFENTSADNTADISKNIQNVSNIKSFTLKSLSDYTKSAQKGEEIDSKISSLTDEIIDFYSLIEDTDFTSISNKELFSLKIWVNEHYSIIHRQVSDLIKSENNIASQKLSSLLQFIEIANIFVVLVYLLIGLVNAFSYKRIFRTLGLDIERVNKQLTTMSENDLSTFTESDSNSLEELSIILDSCNTVSSTLRTTLKTIKESTKQLNNQTEMLLGTSQAMSTATFSIVDSVAQISDGMYNQSDALNTISTTISKFDENLDVCKTTMDAIHTKSSEINTNVLSSSKELSHLNSSITFVKNNFDELDDEITNLTDNISTITNIVNNINEIADKTSMLALNASIESARAGAYGAGFSVISKEIQALSTQTKSFAKEIAILLSVIEKQSKHTSDTSKTASDNLNDSLDVILRNVISLSNVLNNVTEMITDYSAVHDYIQNSSNDAKLIANTVQSITCISQENTAYSQEILAASEKLSLIAADVLDRTEASRELGEDVQNNVNNFKL